MWAIVAGLAVAAAGVTVAVTALTATNPPSRVFHPRTGSPPLALDLGVRVDPEAPALRQAAPPSDSGTHAQSAAIFARYRSLQAPVGRAFARWPDGSLADVQGLASANPRSAFAQLHLGLADFWAGRGEDALAAWRRAVAVEPDSASAVHADDLLHPNF